MRTKDFKINNKEVTAVLMAGGTGFKIYSTMDSLLLVLGRKVNVIDEASPEYKTIISYINLRYYDEMNKALILNEFNKLINSILRRNCRCPDDSGSCDACLQMYDVG